MPRLPQRMTGMLLAIEERLVSQHSLNDFLEIEEGKINDARLYRGLDRILPHKTQLEQPSNDVMASY